MPQAAVPAFMMFGSYILSEKSKREQQRRAREAQETAYEQWEEHAYPSEEAVGAARKKGKTTLTLAREQAEARIGSSLAARGFGPESGAMAGAYGVVEKGYAESLGQFESDITQWAETPGMEMPSAALPSGQYYPGGSEVLQSGLGMMTAMQMYQSMYGPGAQNPYLQYGGYGGGYGGGSTGFGGDYGNWYEGYGTGTSPMLPEPTGY